MSKKLPDTPIPDPSLKLSALEDWILEIATEDDGFVFQLPMVAKRIHGEFPVDLLRLISVGALSRLAVDGLIVVGTSINTFRPIPLEELASFLKSDAAWSGFGESELGTAEYRATDAGIELNDIIDRSGAVRMANIP